MEKMGEKPNWKATDSSPVDTKQENNIGVRNQTTTSSKGRFPLATIVVVLILFVMVSVLLFVLGGAA